MPTAGRSLRPAIQWKNPGQVVSSNTYDGLLTLIEPLFSPTSKSLIAALSRSVGGGGSVFATGASDELELVGRAVSVPASSINRRSHHER